MSNINRLYRTPIASSLTTTKKRALDQAQQGDMVRHVGPAITELSSRQGEITQQLLQLLKGHQERSMHYLWKNVVPVETRQAFDNLNNSLEKAAQKLNEIFSNILRKDMNPPVVDILEVLPDGKTTDEINAREISSFESRTKNEILGGLNSFQAFYLYIIRLGSAAWEENKNNPDSLAFASGFIQKIAGFPFSTRQKNQTRSPLKEEIQRTQEENFNLFFSLARNNLLFLNKIEQLFIEICLNYDSFISSNNISAYTKVIGSTADHSLASLNLSSFWAFAQRLKAYAENAATQSPKPIKTSSVNRICHNDKILLGTGEKITVDISLLRPILHTIMTSIMKRLDQAPAAEIIEEIIYKYYLDEVKNNPFVKAIFENKSEDEKTVLLGLILQAAGFSLQILEYTKDNEHGLALQVRVYPKEASIICIPFYKGRVFERGTEEKQKQQIKKFNAALEESENKQTAKITYPDYQTSGLNLFLGVLENNNNTYFLKEFDANGGTAQSPEKALSSITHITVRRTIDQSEIQHYPNAKVIAPPPSPPSALATSLAAILISLKTTTYANQTAFDAAVQQILKILDKIEDKLRKSNSDPLSIINDLSEASLTVLTLKSAYPNFSHAEMEKAEKKITQLDQDILRNRRT